MVDSLKIFSVSIPSEFTLLSNTVVEVSAVTLFQYPLNLHCSQTNRRLRFYEQAFQYPLNLHCSQTHKPVFALIPLFQYPLNLHCSQTLLACFPHLLRFNTLWIYTALKRGIGTWRGWKSFNTLWIYTALKQFDLCIRGLTSFNTLWIYTALKRDECLYTPYSVSIPSEFTLLSNYILVRRY